MISVGLENDSFISYEGIADDGHWNPKGAGAQDTRIIADVFRITQPTGLFDGLAHQKIVDFDRRVLDRYGDSAYDGDGYFAHLAWIALERSGIWTALNNLSSEDEYPRLNDYGDRSALEIPNGTFVMAAELAAQGQEIDWGHRTDDCGGHNLLFLYAGNIVSKLYPDHGRDGSMSVQSFVFNPALVE